MNLLIVSLMPHHLRDANVVGWGATVRELDHLATRFARVRHVAALHDGPAPATALPYQAANIELVPVRASGGEGLAGKLDAARAIPAYIHAIRSELRSADVVHVRAPANIALVAMAVLAVRPRVPLWIKYAGNWQPSTGESPTYALQRWWLSRPWHRGIVTINGEWTGQAPWLRTFYNPSLTDEDLARGRVIAQRKRLAGPIRLLYVGRVETPKGAGRAIEILARLRERGIAAQLEIIGDGVERPAFEQRAAARGVAAQIDFRGWWPQPELARAYERAHVLLLPSAASEGWPKVLSEGMAYGVVPVAGAVSSIPQYLTRFGTGVALAPENIEGFVDALAGYLREPDAWARESHAAVHAARWFTFSHYLDAVDRLVADLHAR